jgi:hypothetical protein
MYNHIFIYLALFTICCATISATYSIRFFTTSTQDANYQITVNGVEGPDSSAFVPSPYSAWINFGASPGDVVSIKMIGAPFVSYVVNDGPNGSGTQLYDSTSTTFPPLNTCTGTCEVEILGNAFEGSTCNVYVNNELVLENYDGGQIGTFTVSAGDLILIKLTHAGGSTDLRYNLHSDGSEIYNEWYYNAFGFNTLIINPARTPFGGPYYPITSEQIASFARSIGSGKQNSVHKQG